MIECEQHELDVDKLLRFAVVLRRMDGSAECLAVLHHTKAEAEDSALSWVQHFRGGIEAEIVRLEIPGEGEPVGVAGEPPPLDLTKIASKHAELKKLGLDHAIDYTKDDFEAAVRDLTKGKGVHLILDPVGGASWRKGYRLLAKTGRLC